MLGVTINVICCPEILVLPGTFMEKISDYFSNKFSNNIISAQRTIIRTLLGDFHYAPGLETSWCLDLILSSKSV